MNIIKNNSLILIIISMITIQTVQAIEIINNKDISLKINGSIQSLNHYNNKSKEDKILSIIINGKTKKKNNITTFGKIEETINLNNKINKNLNTKLAYIGISHDYLGKIKYGKDYENTNKTLSYTYDIFPYNKSKLIIDNTLTGINNNIFTYEKKINFSKNVPFFKGITILGQYQGIINNKNKNNTIKTTQSGWGTTYNLLTKYGIEISTSYGKKINNKINKDKEQINNVNSELSEIWTTGIKYNIKNIYLASTYSEGNNSIPIYNLINKKNNFKNNYKLSKKNINISIVGKYDFKSGLSPIIGYVQTTIFSPNNNSYSKKDIEKYFDIGLTYKFNKSLNGYIDYKIDQLPKINNKKDNIISVGLTYKF